MSMRRLEMDEDDIQRMLTRVYHEAGYKVDRRDPVIVPYIIQKTMLLDFKKEEAALFDEFAGKVLPPIQAEAGKFEKRRMELMALAQSMAADIVHEAGEGFNRHMQEKSREAIDAAVSRHMDRLTKDLRDAESKLAEKLERQHEAFTDSARQFLNGLSYLAGAAGMLFLAACAWWTWFR